MARKADPDRYVWALFLPPEARLRAFAVLAINRELCRIPHLVSEPVLGQMRFQWWRETLTAMRESKPIPFQEILTPLAEITRAQPLSLQPLLDLVDARESEFLDNAPTASLSAAGAMAGFILPHADLAAAMQGYEQLLLLNAVDDVPQAVAEIRTKGQDATSIPARLLVALSEIYLAEVQRREYNANCLAEVMPHPSRALRLIWKRLWMKGSVS